MTFSPRRYPPPPPMRPWERYLFTNAHGPHSKAWRRVIRVLQRLPLIRRLVNRIFIVDFDTMLYPVIRAVLPASTINDIMSIQPQTTPTPGTIPATYVVKAKA